MNKIEKVMQAVVLQITNGSLRAGMRLPSIRVASEAHGVSKNTIVEAYGRLTAQQKITARPGSGYFVSDRAQNFTEAGKTVDGSGRVEEASDMVSLLRAQLSQNFALRPGDGRPPASWMRGTLPKRIDCGLFSEKDSDHSGYGNAFGYKRIRELIAGQFAQSNVAISTDQIVTTFGANHALDLLTRLYLQPGDAVLVDEPGYYPLFAKLKLARVHIIGVPRHNNGSDLEMLERLAQTHRPKLYFTQSTSQNPTGTSINLQNAHNLLQIAERFGFKVVDDDPFLDLGCGEGPVLAKLDGFKNLIFVGSYSKLLSASLRCGYIVSHREVAREVADLKMITTVNSARYSEILIADMIESGRYAKHLVQLRKRLEEAKTTCLSEIQKLGMQCHTTSPDGYYTLLYFGQNTDLEQFTTQASKQGIFVAPTTWFSVVPGTLPQGIRINFTRSADTRFYSFLTQSINCIG